MTFTQTTGFSRSQNGFQELSSGLSTHRGQLDSALLRATGTTLGQAVYPVRGNGLELAHTPKQSSTIQSYDRDTSQYLDLNIYAKGINIQPQGGRINLPAGTAQSLLGYWFNPSNYVVPQINVWSESDVRANLTSTGVGIWRIEFATTITSQTAGTICFVGVGVDGSVNWPSLQLLHAPAAGYGVPTAGTVYHTSPPAAGPHRVSIFLYASALNTGIHSSMYTALWVTEQRA